MRRNYVMTRKIGMYSSIVVLLAVLGFAISMIISNNYGSYLSSLFIAWGFLPLIASYNAITNGDNKAAGNTAMAFTVIYAVFISAIYFTQLTTVRLSVLSQEASGMLDYQNLGGLFFNLNLLGYAFMAVATFFIGLTIRTRDAGDKWLKALLLIHGIFFISGVLMPILGVFNSDMDGGDFIGTAILEFWCAYFIPVGILSYRYFKKQKA